MRTLLPLLLSATLCAQPAVERRLRTDLKVLAGPEAKGRGNGHPDLDRAAAYLASRYRTMGIPTRLQRYPFVARITREHGRIQLARGESAPLDLTWGRDVEAYGFSADAALPERALAFVGYGIQIADYDDFAGVDLKKRVAVIGRRIPDIPAFAALSRAQRGLLSRLHALEKAGAAAVILLEEDGGVRPLQREEGPAALGIPVLSMRTGALNPVCGDLSVVLQQIRETGKPCSKDFIEAPWTHMKLDLKLKRTEAQIPNLAALVPGREPRLRHEVIAVGAHFDHLGTGERHSLAGESGRDAVHPGADDNASGTALLLELARRLKQRPARRPLLVLHFSGEEEGLLGSTHWVRNPTHDLSSVKFFANFDMVGRLSAEAPRLYLGGLGAPPPALASAIALAPSNLAIAQDLGFAMGGSDHMSFATAKIPTFFFFTGIHGDYHRPTDTLERLNVAGMATVATYAEKVVRSLADAEELPPFDPETARIPSTGGRGMGRIAFGSVPDFSEHPKGFRIQGTSPGSTAESIGLKAGDVILAFGNHPIRNIYDFMEALSSHQPGETVIVRWLREDREMSAEAVLRGRQ